MSPSCFSRSSFQPKMSQDHSSQVEMTLSRLPGQSSQAEMSHAHSSQLEMTLSRFSGQSSQSEMSHAHSSQPEMSQNAHSSQLEMTLSRFPGQSSQPEMSESGFISDLSTPLSTAWAWDPPPQIEVLLFNSVTVPDPNGPLEACYYSRGHVRARG